MTQPQETPVAQSGKPKLLDQVRQRCRVRHLALSTEHAYVNWIRRFVLFHHVRHPLEMGAKEVGDFLTHLAVDGHVAASTQNQALSALLFLYREVLERDFGWLDDVVRAKKPKRLPVVFTPEEAMAVVEELQGIRWLMGMLLYGGGLRLMECFRLRVKDVDFDRLQVIVREGKGDKDRVTLLPEAAVEPLKRHLVQVREAHERAVREGFAGVELPYALARKYPNLDRELAWQYDRVFVAAQLELAEVLRDRVQVGPGLPLPNLANHVHHAVAEVVAGGVEPLDFAAADEAVGQLVEVVLPATRGKMW